MKMEFFYVTPPKKGFLSNNLWTLMAVERTKHNYYTKNIPSYMATFDDAFQRPDWTNNRNCNFLAVTYCMLVVPETIRVLPLFAEHEIEWTRTQFDDSMLRHALQEALKYYCRVIDEDPNLLREFSIFKDRRTGVKQDLGPSR